MAVLSAKMNDLCLKDEGNSLKESLARTISAPQRKLAASTLESLSSDERDLSQLYDVVLLCGPNQCEIFAHRDVLANKVPNLVKMITDNNNEACISLPDVEPMAAQALINFVYSSKLDLSQELVWDVLVVAERLEMKEVLELCQAYVQENILTDSWLYSRRIAVERDSKWLLTAVDNYICEHFNVLLQSAEFLQLPRLQVEIVNKREELRNESEGSLEILRLVVAWCEVKLEEEDLLEGLMEHHHLVYLTSENVLKDCQNSESEGEFITDAQKEYIRQQSNEKNASPVRSPRRSKSLSYKWSKDRSKGKALQFEKACNSCLENQFQLLAGTAVSEGCYVGIAVIASEVVCISAYYNEQAPSSNSSMSSEQAPSCNSSVSSDSSIAEDLGLSLIKPMIRGRCSVGVAEVDNKVFAVGGYDRGHCLNLVECYDQERNEWVPMTSLTCPRGRLGVTCLDGKLYAIGGSKGNSELKSGECFDPDTKQWSKIADMSICRSNFDVCMLDGKLFAVGGTDGCHALKSVEVYNPEKNEWSNVAPLEFGHEGVCVEEMNGHLYACGGYNVWQCLDSVECYNPKDNHWSMVAPLNTARRGAGAAVLNNKLYVIGGTDGNNILKSVECYNSVTNTWTYVASMNSCRHNVGVTVVNGCIFAVGGFDGVAFLNTSEFYDPGLDKWCAFTQV